MTTDTMSLSLEDYAAAFKQADNAENTSKWLQGQIVKQAIDAGGEPDEVCKFIGSYALKSGRTVYRRYQTSRTFQLYDASVSYDLYAAAASIVDYRIKDEDKITARQQEAQAWVEQAIEQEWSPADLRKALKGEIVSHVESYNACVMQTYKQEDGAYAVLRFDEMPPVRRGDEVKLKLKLPGKKSKAENREDSDVS